MLGSWVRAPGGSQKEIKQLSQNDSCFFVYITIIARSLQAKRQVDDLLPCGEDKRGQLQNPVELLKNHPSLELFLGA